MFDVDGNETTAGTGWAAKGVTGTCSTTSGSCYLLKLGKPSRSLSGAIPQAIRADYEYRLYYGRAIESLALPDNVSCTYRDSQASSNFSIAEAGAVTTPLPTRSFLLGAVPAGCETSDLGDNAYSISCTHGENQFIQTVTRSFRLAVCDDNDGNNGHGNSGGYDCSNPGGYANNARVFDYASPKKFSGHQCPTYDTWGVIYNDASGDGWCLSCNSVDASNISSVKPRQLALRREQLQRVGKPRY